MHLENGSRLGPYEIVAAIGAGGMGEVYRARDTRLGREVAIKILPSEFANDAKLRLRFEREAKAISALTHPHICTLHDIGRENGVDYLVMELLDGESVANRVARGPIPLSDAIRYGIQIAEALDRAHRQGIVHRDVKPGNVMLTRSGAKLLDFGLAKDVGHRAESGASFLHTERKTLTEEGTILGTLQYMAPEQLEGLEADARTDIFAFGALLYEMVTAERAFSGATKTSLIAAIVERDPRPMSQFQPVTPPALEHVVNRCLRKQPDDRWQSAFDIAAELRWISEGGSQAGVPPPPGRLRRSREWLAWSAAAILALAAGVLVNRSLRNPPRIVVSHLVPPANARFPFDSGTAILSPDGTRIAFPASTEGVNRLWVRNLDSESAQPLAGTEGAQFPFWSFDGKSIGFFADSKLKRISASGGPAETIASALTSRGGAWGRDDVILFAPSASEPLARVSANGGEVKSITSLEVDRGETSHRFPAFAPDGVHFAVFAQGVDSGNVLLGSVDNPSMRILTTADAGVVFAGEYLLYIRQRTLRAQRVDLESAKLIGEPVNLVEKVQTSTQWNFSNFSASQTGTLSYVGGGSALLNVMKWVDAAGREMGTIGDPAEQTDPRISPDGKKISYSRVDQLGNADIWTYDVARNIPTRVTFSTANEFSSIWSPDSRFIAHTSFDRSTGDVTIKRADGSGEPTVLISDRRRKVPSDWSRDGRYLLFHAITPRNQWDVEAYSFEEKKVIPLLRSPYAESSARFSPDAQWFVYASDESGRYEVYVQHFPDPRGKWQVSQGGGFMPVWSGDGKQIYYYSLDGKLMTVPVKTAPSFSADPPRLLFPVRLRFFVGLTRAQYDVAPDGRFLVNVVAGQQGESEPITLVQNWSLKLQRK